jgi:tetratricopeptide (TPR) repeat protein
MKSSRSKIYVAVAVTVIVLVAFVFSDILLNQNNQSFSIDVEISDERRAELESGLMVVEKEIKEWREDSPPLRLYRLQAEYLSSLGRLSKAERVYRQYLQINPLDKVVLINLSGVLMRMDKVREAEEVYRTIINNFETDEADIYAYTQILTRLNPNDRRIINVLEQAVSSGGQTPFLLTMIADWHISQGNCQQAIENLQIIPQIDPESADQIALDISRINENCQK